MAKSIKRRVVIPRELRQLRRDFKLQFGTTEVFDDFYCELVSKVTMQFKKDMERAILYGIEKERKR